MSFDEHEPAGCWNCGGVTIPCRCDQPLIKYEDCQCNEGKVWHGVRGASAYHWCEACDWETSPDLCDHSDRDAHCCLICGAELGEHDACRAEAALEGDR